MQKLMQHQQAEPAPVRSLRADVPEELAAIIHKMLAKQPETRYQIPLAVAVPLRRFCNIPVPNGTSLRTGPVRPADPPPVSGSFRRPR
jgi:serine/threonine protein kinase